MAYFEDYRELLPGNPYGYMSIPKLIEILRELPQDGFVSTGWNSLPVMTVYDEHMAPIGMIEPHQESFQDLRDSEVV